MAPPLHLTAGPQPETWSGVKNMKAKTNLKAGGITVTGAD